MDENPQLTKALTDVTRVKISKLVEEDYLLDDYIHQLSRVRISFIYGSPIAIK